MNIYVGNLPHQTSEDELRKEFETFGKVSTASIIKDKFSGESRGFGFVEMPNREEAEAAMKGMNAKELQGRSLIVNEARPKTEGGRGGGNRGGGGYGRH